MKLNFVSALLALFVMAACTNKNAEPQQQTAEPDSQTVKVESKGNLAPRDNKKDVVMEVYNLLPKDALPVCFRNIKRTESEAQYGEYNHYVIEEFFEESENNYHVFHLNCFPMADNAYKVYYIYEKGCEYVSIADKAAYIYKDGKLEKSNFDLPTPEFSEFITPEVEANISALDVKEVRSRFNELILYTIDLDTLQVSFNTLGSDALMMGMKMPRFTWNGAEFVAQ